MIRGLILIIVVITAFCSICGAEAQGVAEVGINATGSKIESSVGAYALNSISEDGSTAINQQGVVESCVLRDNKVLFSILGAVALLGVLFFGFKYFENRKKDGTSAINVAGGNSIMGEEIAAIAMALALYTDRNGGASVNGMAVGQRAGNGSDWNSKARSLRKLPNKNRGW